MVDFVIQGDLRRFAAVMCGSREEEESDGGGLLLLAMRQLVSIGEGSIVLVVVVELMDFVECSIVVTDGVSEAARVVGLDDGEVSCV